MMIDMSSRDSETIGDTMEETKERHRRYLRAIENPQRREILAFLEQEEATLESLIEKTGIDARTLKWHMDFLEYGYCAKKKLVDGKVFYSITDEGRVVDYLGE
jgi:DNA-binding transcriptional ArsR family regulator